MPIERINSIYKTGPATSAFKDKPSPQSGVSNRPKPQETLGCGETKAEFDPVKNVLKINVKKPDEFVYYMIWADGSGYSRGFLDEFPAECQTGALSEVFEEAKNLHKKKKKISEEKARKFTREFDKRCTKTEPERFDLKA